MDEILKGLQQPEYLHAILNHLPVVGLLAGLAVLLFALFQRTRATAIAAYAVILATALSVYPVSEFGEKAEDGIQSVLDKDGSVWLHEHEERAEKAAFLFYLTAIFALAGMILPIKFPRTIASLAVATLLCGLIAVSAGVWIASAGGKIRHKEFRYSPLPQPGN
ncbi:MAG TPA: hypothetical protein VIT91_15070 [Chthoniobacterales bacterium]